MRQEAPRPGSRRLEHRSVIVMIVLSSALAVYAANGTKQTDEPRPKQVSSEFLAKKSSVVICGKAVTISPRIEPAFGVAYQVVTFEVEETLKGGDDLSVMMMADIEGKRRKGKFINVIVQVQSYESERARPIYKVGNKYLLFLEYATQFLYSRNVFDDAEKERLWAPELQQEITAALKSTSK
jgi:hypothetical protein